MSNREPYISNWFYVPIELVSDLNTLKQRLTIWIDVNSKYNKESKPIYMYSEKVPGYIGVPIDWGIQTFKHLEFEDRTSMGSGKLIAPKRPDPYHPIYGSQEQANFMQGLIDKLEDNFTVLGKAPTGCHSKGTLIMLSDGKFKKVEDIKVGDYLMGPDSKPKKVLELKRGREAMYKIIPTKGNTFIVNKSHILSLKLSPSKKEQKKQVVNISVEDFLNKSNYFQHRAKLYRVPIDFAESKNITLNPYFLGLMIGDGHLHNQIGFTNSKKILVDCIYKESSILGDTLRISKQKNTCSYFFNGGNTKEKLIKLGLYNCWSGDKFIPDSYKYSSRKSRLEILAGLLDTDGHMASNSFEFSSHSNKLADDVCYVCRSLGLRATKSDKVVKGETYYRVSISGDCSIIPTKAKISGIRKQIKDPLVSGFKLEELGEDDYYGFTVEGHLYLLDDFTVTHNSGKTTCALNTAAEIGLKTLIVVHLDRLADQWKQEAKTHLGLSNNQIGTIQQGVCQYERQLCVATVQTLTSRKYADDFYSSFGMVIFDETHKYGSENFSKVIGMFNPAYRLTLSATPNRKDDSTRILQYSFGPVRVQSKAESLPIILKPFFLKSSGVIKTYNRNSLINRLTSDISRNDFIVGRIKKRYLEGRHCLVISERIEHLELLYKSCIDLGINEKDMGLFVGQRTVNGKRKKVTGDQLEYVKNNSQIIFATYGMMTEGINIPRLSWGIDTIPRANADQFTQLKGRIARPKEGKPNPIWETLVDSNSSECVAYYYSRIKKCSQENTTIENPGETIRI